jgi:hypothetical protein
MIFAPGPPSSSRHGRRARVTLVLLVRSARGPTSGLYFRLTCRRGAHFSQAGDVGHAHITIHATGRDEAAPERLFLFERGAFVQSIRVCQLVPDERRQHEPIQGIPEFCLPERRSLSNHDDRRLAAEHKRIKPAEFLSCATR